MTRFLGRSELWVSAVGMGCWPIGGYFTFCGKPDSYGAVDDLESKRAIERALDMGCNFFDTADVYGTGHSEEILGEALKGRRQGAVIATKFGYLFDPAKRDVPGDYDVSGPYIRKACEASLKRLQTEYIDLYQLHVGEIQMHEVEPLILTLDQLKKEGKIREYGWSTGSKELADIFCNKSDGVSLQFSYNIFKNGIEEKEMIALCDRHHYSGIINSPLAMGFLSGKYGSGSKVGPDDVRGSGYDWVPYFENGRPRNTFLGKLSAIREILTSEGRSMAQGAIAWIWAQNGALIPITGFKTVKQVEENIMAMKFGPLTKAQMGQIDSILSGE